MQQADVAHAGHGANVRGDALMDGGRFVFQDGEQVQESGFVRFGFLGFGGRHCYSNFLWNRTQELNGTAKLAIEVLSKSNTKKEMARKRREYFKAGVQLVWEIDAAKRIATVFTSVTDFEVLDDSQSLTGGDGLPDFSLALSELFDEAEEK